MSFVPEAEAEADLYSLTLRLPAHIDDADISVFSFTPCDESRSYKGGRPLSILAAREGNDHRAAWTLVWFFDGRPDARVLSEFLNAVGIPAVPPVSPGDFTLEKVPETDWLKQCYRQFEPFHESGFYIYGSHIAQPEPGPDIAMQIDATTAFGSGEHGTTAGCLNLLARLKAEGFNPESVLDLGTGSGILGVAACKLWKTRVVASDIDPEAVRVAAHHRDINHVAVSNMECIESNGFAAQNLQQKTAYNLVIANILAGPLREMSRDIALSCAPGGFIVLSGMLHEQALEIEDLYCGLGCSLAARVERDPWTSLLLRKA